MSGIGKGVFAGSLAALLGSKGVSVVPFKLEGYLNVDSGTINPDRHGEVFVLDDGTECDLDLGSYERFLDRNLSSANFYTAGRLFSTLLARERRGEFLGRDIQVVPHFTGQLKYILRKTALEQKAEVIIIEVGGTVGDLESGYYLEALRELALEEGRSNVAFCHVTPVILDRKGEQKTKPTQHSVRRLLEAGIQPDIVVLRSSEFVLDSTKQKVALFCNVPIANVASCVDNASVYAVPYDLQQQGILEVLINRLVLHPYVRTEPTSIPWKEFVHFVANPPHDEVVIGMCAKYREDTDSYLSIIKALEHCQPKIEARIRVKWLSAEDIEKSPSFPFKDFEDIDGLIVPGGFGRRGVEGKIAAIRFARTHKVPYLGICLGCQLALIEFARTVCGLADANSTEFAKDCKDPVISLLEEQKGLASMGGTMRLGGADVSIAMPSKAFVIYGTNHVRERFRHRYEFDRRYEKLMSERGLVVTGTTPDNEIAQLIEISDHPFFIGTQFHPEFLSRPDRPHPLFLHLSKAAYRFSTEGRPLSLFAEESSPVR
jgi:CTP synthase